MFEYSKYVIQRDPELQTMWLITHAESHGGNLSPNLEGHFCSLHEATLQIDNHEREAERKAALAKDLAKAKRELAKEMKNAERVSVSKDGKLPEGESQRGVAA